MKRFIVVPLLVFFFACSSDSVEPIFEEQLLQSVQLHHPTGQIDYDSLTYNNQNQLSRILRESTGWIDRLVYNFEYDPNNAFVYLIQNGNASADFIRRETFNAAGQLIEVEIKKEDGTHFATNHITYNSDGTVTVEKYGAQSQLEDVETIELDQQGNQVRISYNNGASVVVMEYDTNPNPFYGMALQTAHFNTHSPNNQTLFQIFQNGNLFFERTYNYQYGTHGYPNQVEAFTNLPNDQKETFYFYYQ